MLNSFAADKLHGYFLSAERVRELDNDLRASGLAGIHSSYYSGIRLEINLEAQLISTGFKDGFPVRLPIVYPAWCLGGQSI